MKQYRITTTGLIGGKVQSSTKIVSEMRVKRFQHELEKLPSKISKMNWLTSEQMQYAIDNPYLTISEVK